MENTWASPEGYAQPPTAVRYEILDGDEVVQRETVSAWDHGRSRYYHCLQGKDQRMANEITALIQQACEYFYVPDGEYEPMEGVDGVLCAEPDVRGVICGHVKQRHIRTHVHSIPSDWCLDCATGVRGEADERPEHPYRATVLTDDEVRTRIDRINQGENTREAERSKLKFYPLDELPFETQRALIERIEECKRAHSFRILGEVKDD